MEIKTVKIDINESYGKLLSVSGFSMDYIFMIIMATVLCVLGFVMDSEAVVIGAMVISPLLNPLVAFSASVIRKDKKNIYRFLRVIIAGLAIAIVVSFLLSLFWPSELYQSELIAKLQGKPFIYFLVAICSGMAATFCFYWPKTSQVISGITGVAIAVALIPPITIFGISLATNRSMMYSSGLIVLLNIIGIFIGSLIILYFLRHRFVNKG